MTDTFTLAFDPEAHDTAYLILQRMVGYAMRAEWPDAPARDVILREVAADDDGEYIAILTELDEDGNPDYTTSTQHKLFDDLKLTIL